jgi:predicted amidohydrolase
MGQGDPLKGEECTRRVHCTPQGRTATRETRAQDTPGRESTTTLRLYELNGAALGLGLAQDARIPETSRDYLGRSQRAVIAR